MPAAAVQLVPVCISIHALREEGDFQAVCRMLQEHRISIHALREEGDFQAVCRMLQEHRISIHALREEGDGLLKTND